MHIHHDHLSGPHAHEHNHTHTHEHEHDGVVHSHPHDHAHQHDHAHPHEHDHLHGEGHTHDHHHHDCDHSCDHECGGECSCGGECRHTPMEELVALMKYMVGHNTSHANELAALARQLEAAGEKTAFDQVMAAVADFEKGNMRLSVVLSALEAK